MILSCCKLIVYAKIKLQQFDIQTKAQKIKIKQNLIRTAQ